MDPESREAQDARLAKLDRIRNAERRAAISRVASVIAHLIGTPLQVIAGRAALIRSNPTQEATVENARRIEEQVERLAQRIRRLIEYLTSPEHETEQKSVASLVMEALSIYTPIALHHGVKIGCSGSPPDGIVEGNSAIVVLTSLFSLAVRVAPQGSTIELGFDKASDSAIGFELEIPGFTIPDTPIDRLDPSETVDGASAEHLQVLSVCYAIAKRSGGKLQVIPNDGQSAVVRLECPCSFP